MRIWLKQYDQKTAIDQQQRCWRNARNPEFGFVHARGPRLTQGERLARHGGADAPKARSTKSSVCLSGFDISLRAPFDRQEQVGG